jgi:hypothetical protein
MCRSAGVVIALAIVGCVPQPQPVGVSPAYGGPPSPSPPAAAAVDGAAPAPTVAAAHGSTVTDDVMGWRIHVPDRWRYGAEGDTAVLRSDAEAGMIVITFENGATADGLETTIDHQIRAFGGTPLGRPRRHAIGERAAVFAELAARDDDGGEVRGRAIAIAGDHGALIVLSATAAAAYDNLRQRTDAVALSADLFAPKPPPAATPPPPPPTDTTPTDGIAGCYESYRVSKTYGTPQWGHSHKISFDGHGRSRSGATTVFTGGYDGAIESDPDFGTYKLDGETLEIRWNGGSGAVRYVVVLENGKVRAFHTADKKKWYLRC